jgi:4-amino-4-deoxy-L-arabinose transferase-like glycosyltransferase
MGRRRSLLAFLALGLLAIWCTGMFGRGYWTPDEPREADIAWRMSWQPQWAVPLLAGEAFCEKPPLTYWLAAIPVRAFGMEAWAARLPNLFYALITSFSVGLLARRAAGRLAGLVAAAAISTFLLAYQVEIWLATDAPLLAAVSLALYGLYVGFHATHRRERLAGYTLMHAALAVGFLCKSAAAWLTPVTALLVLIVWERRWRELLRWELYIGLLLQAAIVAGWVWSVAVGPDGAAHLRIFFWNNLVGRFTNVDAPAELQYATAHRNSPGKYLLELPVYLWPWTLLCLAALRRAWAERGRPPEAVRYAIAVFLPTLVILSCAATARNIYLAPALPGLALLLGWWVALCLPRPDPWDLRALRATAVLLLLAVVVVAALMTLVGTLERAGIASPLAYWASSGAGLLATTLLIGVAWFALGRGRLATALLALLVGYCSLLAGPAAEAYSVVDQWQDLQGLGEELRADLRAAPLVLMAPDETTRAWVDMYVRPSVSRVPGPIDAVSLAQLQALLVRTPGALVLAELPGRAWTPRWREIALALGRPAIAVVTPAPAWMHSGLEIVGTYALPNGRRYALLRLTRADDETASRIDPPADSTRNPAPSHSG